jgi:hypothetical protein
MAERASRSGDAVKRSVDVDRLRVEQGSAESEAVGGALTRSPDGIAPDPRPGAGDPAQGLRVKRFGARVHLLIEVPSIRRAVFILRADFTAIRKWIMRAWTGTM